MVQALYRASPFGNSWQGSLRNLANVISHIRRLRMFGRLSLRNTERLSVAHLYFHAGKLVHIVGNRGDARAILLELREWRRAFVRFDRGIANDIVSLGEEHEQLLYDVLLYLHKRGLVAMQQMSRIIESSAVITTEARRLITPEEWHILVEGTRRVSRAVAHLVGPREALSVLQDILSDCSAAFPAFACIEIAPSGYLRVIDRSQLDSLPRADLLEGFTALIATCQYFCSPIIGDKDAHKLIIQALNDLCPALVNLGVYHIDHQLLALKD